MRLLRAATPWRADIFNARMTSRNALNSALRKLNKACEQRKL